MKERDKVREMDRQRKRERKPDGKGVTRPSLFIKILFANKCSYKSWGLTHILTHIHRIFSISPAVCGVLFAMCEHHLHRQAGFVVAQFVVAPDLPHQLCCKVRREGYGGEVNKLDQSNCFTGPLESERRKERDITLSEFNILLSDTDRTFELSVDMAESLGAS